MRELQPIILTRNYGTTFYSFNDIFAGHVWEFIKWGNWKDVEPWAINARIGTE